MHDRRPETSPSIEHLREPAPRAWTYEPAPDLALSVAERLATFPRYPDLSVYALRTALHLGLRAYLHGYHRLEIRGRHHLPIGESFVLACNHTSHLDTLCLLSCLPLRQLHRAFPAAAADYFFSTLPRSLGTAIFVNGLPFERDHNGAESLELCRQILARPGHVLILFPEGTRNPSDELGRFRSGIARLVAGSSTPVVPCHLSGGREAFPKGAHLPRPRRLRLSIGAARRFDHVAPSDRSALAAVCTRLRSDVAALSDAAPADL